MGKKGNHISSSISIGQYRYDSKERRRRAILQDCNGDCSRAANTMKQVIASYPDNEIERKARSDRRYFIELSKIRNGHRR